jgi:uncharacterized membrane protein YhaH (DUF805 family)
MRSYFDAMLRYFDLSGRSTRRQYWLFWLVATLLALAGAFADLEFFYTDIRKGYPGPFTAFLSVVHFLPAIAVTVRRLHDIGRSGWWYFVQCIPLVGQLLMLFWMLAPPNQWDNEFGPNPRTLASAAPARQAQRSTIPRQVRMGSAPPAQARGAQNPDVERFI